MPHVVRDGVSVHYEVSGKGPTIVFTHSCLCDGCGNSGATCGAIVAAAPPRFFGSTA